MIIFIDCLAAAGGFALCWITKDTLTHMFIGTEAFVRNLEAKARAVKAGFSAKAQ